ncbi:MAG: hypothetical protein R3F59_05045 [Myxococcota bacterium]
MGDPVVVLMEDPDPIARARAHLALGAMALARNAVEAAAEHLQEAIELDPTDEAPRQLLEQVAEQQQRRPKRWWRFGR